MTFPMNRRAFIAGLGGAAVWPFAARAQQPAMPVIGFLGSDTPDLYTARLRAIRLGLKDAGFVEGQNLAVEYRWAEGQNDRLPALAAEFVRQQVAVIATSTTPAALALKAATANVPVVFFVAGDPVALGLVTSLSRPGGNFTGTTTLTLDVGSKWLELMHEMIPEANTFGLLVNPTSPNLAESQLKDAHDAAGVLGLALHVLRASTDREIEASFASLSQERAGGLIISSDSFFFTRTAFLADLALKNLVPAIFGFREFPTAGGLMSYGADLSVSHRTLGVYIGRILRGEKPADLPVQQATKVELIINFRTAKTLGISVPLPLLGRADEVIE
jgi:putative tryptophan/tyrosine transport system substrate-binding protein